MIQMSLNSKSKNKKVSWYFKKDNWIWLLAKIPGTIVENLLENKKILDIYNPKNFKFINEFVSNSEWFYWCDFSIPINSNNIWWKEWKEIKRKYKYFVLEFNGLDIGAEIWLNNKK